MSCSNQSIFSQLKDLEHRPGTLEDILSLQQQLAHRCHKIEVFGSFCQVSDISWKWEQKVNDLASKLFGQTVSAGRWMAESENQTMTMDAFIACIKKQLNREDF